MDCKPRIRFVALSHQPSHTPRCCAWELCSPKWPPPPGLEVGEVGEINLGPTYPLRCLVLFKSFLSHRIHGAAIYGNMDPINIPPMLAYIPYMDPMGMWISTVNAHGFLIPKFDNYLWTTLNSPRLVVVALLVLWMAQVKQHQRHASGTASRKALHDLIGHRITGRISDLCCPLVI